MQTAADLIIMPGIPLLVIAGLSVVAWVDRAKLEMKCRRRDARRGVTNYARIQARMALGNGVIKGEK